MGEMAYNYLALEANTISGQFFPGWPYPPSPEFTYGNIGHLSPASSYGSSVASPRTAYVLILGYFPENCLTSHSRDGPFLFSPSPSPSLSQASIPEDHQQSPSPSPTPEPGCHKATPMFNHIRGKWCCSACDKTFRGKWECRRHIGITGKRATCLACKTVLTRRGDSLKRHFTKYCRGDIVGLRFEDAFAEV